MSDDILRGLAGVAPGTTITIANAVPCAGFEFDPPPAELRPTTKYATPEEVAAYGLDDPPPEKWEVVVCGGFGFIYNGAGWLRCVVSARLDLDQGPQTFEFTFIGQPLVVDDTPTVRSVAWDLDLRGEP